MTGCDTLHHRVLRRGVVAGVVWCVCVLLCSSLLCSALLCSALPALPAPKFPMFVRHQSHISESGKAVFLAMGDETMPTKRGLWSLAAFDAPIISRFAVEAARKTWKKPANVPNLTL